MAALSDTHPINNSKLHLESKNLGNLPSCIDNQRKLAHSQHLSNLEFKRFSNNN